eukprot:symbB.v1.2.009905.t1/scaffold605.1/size182108/5
MCESPTAHATAVVYVATHGKAMPQPVEHVLQRMPWRRSGCQQFKEMERWCSCAFPQKCPSAGRRTFALKSLMTSCESGVRVSETKPIKARRSPVLHPQTLERSDRFIWDKAATLHRDAGASKPWNNFVLTC